MVGWSTRVQAFPPFSARFVPTAFGLVIFIPHLIMLLELCAPARLALAIRVRLAHWVLARRSSVDVVALRAGQASYDPHHSADHVRHATAGSLLPLGLRLALTR